MEDDAEGGDRVGRLVEERMETGHVLSMGHDDYIELVMVLLCDTPGRSKER